jgi:hypothetical protein
MKIEQGTINAEVLPNSDMQYKCATQQTMIVAKSMANKNIINN